MNCFNHPVVTAVGTCKACGKGLCHDCVLDMGHGLSCKGEHEITVQAYDDMLKRNARILAAAPRNIILAPIFYAFMGVVFVAWALSSPRGVKDFTFIFGCGFLMFAALAYRQASRSIQQ
ncbi:hypothetical protein [Dyella sp. 20L07]|uniref:hypothetical protein n=1 Tax=Dyella sp. 20L07 TaxID=3384240 RepID=UPI003D271B32